jgi:hypothetical protein
MVILLKLYEKDNGKIAKPNPAGVGTPVKKFL